MRCSTSQVNSSVRLAPLAWALAAAACSNGNDVAVVSSAEDAAATLDRYCSECHNAAEFAGDFSVTSLDPAAVHENPELWERIVRKLRTRTMPPQERAAARSRRRTIRSRRGSTPRSTAGRRRTPGAPALRRLNRAEYANAIRDLLDLDVDVNAAAAARRFRVRLRQQRRSARGLARAARALSRRLPIVSARWRSAIRRRWSAPQTYTVTRRSLAGDCISRACRSEPSAA